ncbi:hypothetical protein Tco_1072589 [Tanacetum coccineum]
MAGLTGVCYAIGWVFPYSLFRSRAQLAPGSLRQIFMETMMYRVRVLLVSNIGSSPLTQTGVIDFLLGRAVIEVAQRKRVKYEDKCAAIRYGFLPFSFSSFGELEKDAVTN